MTNVLLPHSAQTCQGFSSPLVYWWYWPKFPFWTYNGKVRQNRLVPCLPGWLPLPERELLGDYDDRREVTYYLPTPQEIALANELFPGQGLAPPWYQICNKLESYLPWASVHKLKCDQALALYRWAIVCEREQQQQRAQQTFVNLVSEAMLKLLLEDCQRQKQAEAEKVAAEQPVEVSAPDKVTAEQSKGAAPSASQQSSPEAQPATTEPGEPADWVIGWRAIDDILRLGELWPKTTYQERRKRLKRLNESWGGPVRIGPKGRQPKVSRSKLLEWWNHLGEKVESEEAKQQDAAATVAAQYLYGCGSSVVCPDIRGSIKR